MSIRDTVIEAATRASEASRVLATASGEQRAEALQAMAHDIRTNAEAIKPATPVI